MKSQLLVLVLASATASLALVEKGVQASSSSINRRAKRPFSCGFFKSLGGCFKGKRDPDEERFSLLPIEQDPAPPLEQDPTLPKEQDPTPPVKQDPTPSIEQDPAPPIKQDPAPTTEQEPAPPIKQEPAPSTEQDPTPPIEQDPAPPLEQDPTLPKEQDPAPPLEQDPTLPKEQNPPPLVKQDLTSSIEQDPAPLINQDPVPSTEQEPAPPIKQDLITQDPTPAMEQDPDEERFSLMPIEQDPTLPKEQNPLPLVKQDLTSSIEQDPAPPINQDPTPSIEQEPAPPINQDPITQDPTPAMEQDPKDERFSLMPIEQDPAPPLEQDPTLPKEKDPAPSTEQEPAPPIKQDPTEQDPTPPIEQDPAPPLKQDSMPPIEQGSVLPITQDPTPAMEQDPSSPIERDAVPLMEQDKLSTEQYLEEDDFWVHGFEAGLDHQCDWPGHCVGTSCSTNGDLCCSSSICVDGTCVPNIYGLQRVRLDPLQLQIVPFKPNRERRETCSGSGCKGSAGCFTDSESGQEMCDLDFEREDADVGISRHVRQTYASTLGSFQAKEKLAWMEGFEKGLAHKHNCPGPCVGIAAKAKYDCCAISSPKEGICVADPAKLKQHRIDLLEDQRLSREDPQTYLTKLQKKQDESIRRRRLKEYKLAVRHDCDWLSHCFLRNKDGLPTECKDSHDCCTDSRCRNNICVPLPRKYNAYLQKLAETKEAQKNAFLRSWDRYAEDVRHDAKCDWPSNCFGEQCGDESCCNDAICVENVCVPDPDKFREYRNELIEANTEFIKCLAYDHANRVFTYNKKSGEPAVVVRSNGVSLTCERV